MSFGVETKSLFRAMDARSGWQYAVFTRVHQEMGSWTCMCDTS
jgi:hypothetical protein